MIEKLDFDKINTHYAERLRAHQELRRRLAAADEEGYAKLALGLENSCGNHSASEHGLGIEILDNSPASVVHALAQRIETCPATSHLPGLIHKHRIPYLGVSVGTEMAMMLRPGWCWVGNTRTYWLHLYMKYNGDLNKAEEELQLYKSSESDSEMAYQVWQEMYLAVEPSLRRIGDLGARESSRQLKSPGNATFIWADSVTNEFYEKRLGIMRGKI